jgi:hypothetical protein
MAYPDDLFTAQWIWEGESQLAEDAYVNTWHFENKATLSGNFDNMTDMLRDFYSEVPPGTTTSISNYMSTEAITGKWTIKVYDMSDPKPRYPVYTDTGQIGMSGGSTLPTECAAVMSFQGIRIAGQVQARRRNRVYLGPFSITGNSEGKVSPGLVETILFAGKELLNAAQASQSWEWVVYSPTANAIVELDNGWVDNGWDTQRRRGIRSTARGTFGTEYPT